MKFAYAAQNVFCAIAFTATMHATTFAQQTPQVKRSILLKQDMTLADREAVMAAIELPPGSAEGRHTHPAELYVYLIEGEIVLENEGQPDRVMKAGDVASVAPGRVHQALNRGSMTAKGVAVFVAEKGKPLAAPAP
jgi:quercetin dioxygenase-like cupin family protein